MKKPTLLYASPLPPMPSGISDYSKVLVDALSAHFDITLFTDNYKITDKELSSFPVLKYGQDNINFDKFDYHIYNIGNNPDFHSYIYEAAIDHPGLVILHDIVLYYLFVGYYSKKGTLYSSTYEKMGLNDFLIIKEAVRKDGPALLEQKHMAAKLTMNSELLSSGNRLMVHSEFARNTILRTGLVKSDQIIHINHIDLIGESTALEKRKLFAKYNIPEDSILISSFGYIANTKLNIEICHAVRELSKKMDMKICYLMVGEGGYADAELEEGLIKKTGYTELEEFNSFIAYSDIVINLRNPSMGETSGAMMRILKYGKPCITNNGGWFSEIPDNVVYKIELDRVEENLEVALSELLSRPDLQKSMGQAAKNYILNEYNKEKIAQQVFDFATA